MINLMTDSGIWALTYETGNGLRSTQLQDEANKDESGKPEGFPILRNLAISQLLLTLFTLTTAHVQIITRISSAYPVWLWYLAAELRKGVSSAGQAVIFIVMYGIIQGGLFASFLPPA